ncbi:MAG TPA: hypothetical protein VK935_23650 [Actinomycetospora sp.]|nr:hypothetical protein [Actinomycetospora sp.]
MVEHDERLRARNKVHLDGLRGEPGALVNSRGRVLAASPGATATPRRPGPSPAPRPVPRTPSSPPACAACCRSPTRRRDELSAPA